MSAIENYTITSSEKLRKSGDEAETRALLYLAGRDIDREEMYYFAIDFFNDVSGVNENGDKIWDVQSKADKNVRPKDLGKKLVTLYKNYVSSLNKYILKYILFVGSISSAVLKDDKLSVFDISNIVDSKLKSIISGLCANATDKEYIDPKFIDEVKINDFLGRVWFVVDNKSSDECVEIILRNYTNLSVDKVQLQKIFDEICNKQSQKKTGSVVENLKLSTTLDFLDYNRSIKESEIRSLIVQRIVTNNEALLKCDGSIPLSFVDIVKDMPKKGRKEMIQKCHSEILKTLFANSIKELFWKLFENILEVVYNNPDEDDVRTIYSKLDRDIVRLSTFQEMTLLYFISIIKDCFENEGKIVCNW